MLNVSTTRILNSIDGIEVKTLTGLKIPGTTTDDKSFIIKGVFSLNKRNFVSYERLEHISPVHSVLAIEASQCALENEGLYRLIFRATSELSHEVNYTNSYDRTRTFVLEFEKKEDDNATAKNIRDVAKKTLNYNENGSFDVKVKNDVVLIKSLDDFVYFDKAYLEKYNEIKGNFELYKDVTFVSSDIDVSTDGGEPIRIRSYEPGFGTFDTLINSVRPPFGSLLDSIYSNDKPIVGVKYDAFIIHTKGDASISGVSVANEVVYASVPHIFYVPNDKAEEFKNKLDELKS